MLEVRASYKYESGDIQPINIYLSQLDRLCGHDFCSQYVCCLLTTTDPQPEKERHCNISVSLSCPVTKIGLFFASF